MTEVRRRSVGNFAISASLIFITCLSSCYAPPLLQPGDPVPLEWQQQSQYYLPTVYSAPMLHTSESFAIQGVYRAGSEAAGVGLDAAVRIAPKWALSGNYANYTFKKDYRTETRQWELGGGYTSSINKDWNYEGFAGFGNMNFDYTYFNGSATVKSNFCYLQPALYYNYNKQNTYFTAGFATRISLQNPDVTSKNVSSVNPQVFTEQQLGILESTHSIWALEPGIILRIGIRQFQVTAQYFGMVHLQSTELYGKDDMFSFGLRFAVPRQTSHKTSKPVNPK